VPIIILKKDRRPEKLSLDLCKRIIFYLRWCGLFLCSLATLLSYLGGSSLLWTMIGSQILLLAEFFRFVFMPSFLLSGLSEYNLVLNCPYRLVGCLESWPVLFALLRRLCSPATRNYSTND
jgi:hypothetical protein